MQTKKTITVALATLLVSGAVAGGVAMARSPASGKAPVGNTSTSTENSAVDPDNVQEGDQTGPETPDANEAPDTGSENGSEATSESAAESDGPGGHEDPPGNVNHQFEGEE